MALVKILLVTLFVILLVITIGYTIHFLYNAFKQKCAEYDKMKGNFLLLYDWMDLNRTKNNALASLLWEKGYKEIIIYGWGYLGMQLYKDLQDTQIKIKGILDRKIVNNFNNIPTYSLKSELPEVDAVIITVLYDGGKIRNDVGKKVDCPIVSLEELI